MNILILEDEDYLRENIILRLDRDGHNCSVKFENDDDHFDVVLLSLNKTTQIIDKITNLYLDSAIIFLGNCTKDIYNQYILNSKLNDYIPKPFKVEELVQKIYHYYEFIDLKKQNEMQNSYYNFVVSRDLKYEQNNIDKDILLDEILTIDDYLKTIILSFQTIYTDVQLSKKLGMDRKTLWNKRKKLNI